jgi:ribosome-associated protein
MKSRKSSALELVKTCCRVLDDKKAGDVRVLEVGELSSITDYLVLATATSDPHLRALRADLEKTLKEAGVKVVGVETASESGWTIVDLFDVMIHLFRADVRARYGLENLWKDAVEVSSTGEPMAKAAPKRAAKTPVKKPAKPAKRVGKKPGTKSPRR